jgi:hypothetical protein
MKRIQLESAESCMAPSAELTQKWPCFILYISRFLILYHHNNNGRVSLVRERPPNVEVQIKRRKPLAVFNLHLKEKEKNEQRNERHIDEYFVTFSRPSFFCFAGSCMYSLLLLRQRSTCTFFVFFLKSFIL